MSTWADQSEYPTPSYPPQRSSYTGEGSTGGGGGGGQGGGFGGGGGSPPQRKRLQLKPRSAQGVAQAQSTSSSRRSSNPFGAAKPREEVLASKGIDARLVDERIQKKASVVHLTRDQEAEVEALRQELTNAEESLRDANEKELPEEKFRVLAEQKRKELNNLMAKFAEMNAEKEKAAATAGGTGSAGSPRGTYERPSERRRRLEEQQQHHGGSGRRGGGGGHGGHYEDDYGEDAYSSFGGRNQGGGGGRRGGSRDGNYEY